MKAQKKGVDTQNIIDNLIALIQKIVNEKITEAEQYTGDKKVDKELEKCKKEFEKAQKDLGACTARDKTCE